MMRVLQKLAVLSALCIMSMVCLTGMAETGNGMIRQRAEQVRALGFALSDDVLESILAEGEFYFHDAESDALLLALGAGHYDYDTGDWSPFSNEIYAFDEEVFDEDHMYTLFLKGVQAIVPDIEITEVREDLSGLNEYHEGVRSVSFLCNGHPYTFQLKGMRDWFDLDMLGYMAAVIEAEGCPFKLYSFEADYQFVALFYGDQAKAASVEAFLH